jgi:hypothetical protein
MPALFRIVDFHRYYRDSPELGGLIWFGFQAHAKLKVPPLGGVAQLARATVS